MNILQICPDYYNTELYKNLFNELKNKNVANYIYIPTNNKNKEYINDRNDDKVFFIPSFNSLDRLIFYSKQKKMFKKLERYINTNTLNLIHAHTLFSSGFLAYKLNKKYNIPYIVAIRNTDVNIFFKYMVHLRSLGIDIMKNAEKIIFISPKYMKFVLDKYVPKGLFNKIKNKCVVIPNGIDYIWLKDYDISSKHLSKNKISFTQVGTLNKNKNYKYSLKIINTLQKLGYNTSFNIVGTGKYEKKIKKWCKEDNTIKYYGKLKFKEIIKLYKNTDIFIMPSINETFGLVYIEAMSQGIPVIYKSGQGIDGYFEDFQIGISIDNNIRDSIDKILKLINNYNNISTECIKSSKEFSWDKIANKYYKIYLNILNL